MGGGGGGGGRRRREEKDSSVAGEEDKEDGPLVMATPYVHTCAQNHNQNKKYK